MVLMNTVLMIILVVSIIKQQKVQNTLERLVVDIRISEKQELETAQAELKAFKQKLAEQDSKDENSELRKTM